MNGVDILQQNHKKINDLFSHLDQCKDIFQRQQTVDKLVQDASVHLALEENVVYPTIQRLNDKDATRFIKQEDELKQSLGHLRMVQVTDANWSKLVQSTREALLAHFQDEEANMFPFLRAKLSDSMLNEMGTVLFGLQRSVRPGFQIEDMKTSILHEASMKTFFDEVSQTFKEPMKSA